MRIRHTHVYLPRENDVSFILYNMRCRGNGVVVVLVRCMSPFRLVSRDTILLHMYFYSLASQSLSTIYLIVQAWSCVMYMQADRDDRVAEEELESIESNLYP